MPELSIVIVTVKDEGEILCIPKFKDSTFSDYEIIIQDDPGIAKARNEGVKKANADKIIFIDDDAEPTEGYLQAAANVLDRENIVVGKVIHPGDGIISQVLSHYPVAEEGQYVGNVVGCNMGFRKEVFETVGHFDESFLWGHEESEFIERAKKYYPVYYHPDMTVVHSYADNILDYWRKQHRFGPADVHRRKLKGKTNRDIIVELLNPMWYFNSNPKTLPVFAIGRACRSFGRLQTLRQKKFQEEK